MRKIGIICLVLVLALGMLGAAYASWSQTLTITEEVNTGDFCIEFGTLTPGVTDSIGPNAWDPPEYYPTDYPDENATFNFAWVGEPDPGKNVAWGEAAYDAGANPIGLSVTLHDVYPWYYNHLDFWIHNCGTIPADLHRVYVVDSAGNEYDVVIPGPDGQIITLDLDNNGTDDFQIKFGDHLGDQIEPCEDWNMSFGMVVLQDDDVTWQDNTFTFYVYYVFDQWNYEP